MARDRNSALICWIGIVGNAAQITWTAVFLVDEFVSCAPAPLHFVPIVFIALFFADWLSGFVHWATDTWFDEYKLEYIISIAREHHLYPHHILDYGFRDYVAYSSWPTLLLVGPIALWLTMSLPRNALTFEALLICLIVSMTMFFGTYAHRLGHRHSGNRLVRWLQHRRFLITPQYHSLHHRGDHDTHYCVINGWANTVCDRIGFWRFAERLVERVSGAVARQNDHSWFERFRTDPTFPRGRTALEARARTRE